MSLFKADIEFYVNTFEYIVIKHSIYCPSIWDIDDYFYDYDNAVKHVKELDYDSSSISYYIIPCSFLRQLIKCYDGKVDG